MNRYGVYVYKTFESTKQVCFVAMIRAAVIIVLLQLKSNHEQNVFFSLIHRTIRHI